MVLFGGVTQSTVLFLKGGLLGDKCFPIWVLLSLMDPNWKGVAEVTARWSLDAEGETLVG